MGKLVAIGNGGGRMADVIRKNCPEFNGEPTVYCDTSEEDLAKHGRANDQKIVIGNSKEWMDNILNGIDGLYIICGLAGSSGSIATYIASEARKRNIKNVAAIITLPFSFEDEDRRIVAYRDFESLKEYCGQILIQHNDNLRKLGFLEAGIELNWPIALLINILDIEVRPRLEIDGKKKYTLTPIQSKVFRQGLKAKFEDRYIRNGVLSIWEPINA